MRNAKKESDKSIKKIFLVATKIVITDLKIKLNINSMFNFQMFKQLKKLICQMKNRLQLIKSVLKTIKTSVKIEFSCYLISVVESIMNLPIISIIAWYWMSQLTVFCARTFLMENRFETSGPKMMAEGRLTKTNWYSQT